MTLTFRFGRTAMYIRQQTCVIRRRWTGDYCLHVEYHTARRLTNNFYYFKVTEKCMATKPESIVRVTIKKEKTTHRPNAKYVDYNFQRYLVTQ